MHRPSNVDTRQGLEKVLKLVENTALYKTVVFPLHPRTRANLTRLGLMPPLVSIPNVRLLEPQGYLEFLNLMEHAAIVHHRLGRHSGRNNISKRSLPHVPRLQPSDL